MQWLFDIIEEILSDKISKLRVYRDLWQSIPHNTWTKIIFDEITFDTRSEFAGGTFTATDAGFYHVDLTVYLRDPTANTLALCAIYKNGARWSSNRYHVAFNSHLACGYSDIVQLQAGDTIEGWFIHTSGLARWIEGHTFYTFMAIQKIL